MTIHLTIKGCPRTKKNSSQIVKIQGRSRLIPSKPYREYEKLFLAQVPERYKLHLNLPQTVKCLYYMETHRIVDIAGLEQATYDILVRAGVLQDDNSRIIASQDGSRVLYDKENPRVEISIIPMAQSVGEQGE